MSVGTRLRLSLIDGPELRCAHCGEWWAITPEFWANNNFSRCRACSNERAAMYQALRRRDPAFRSFEIDKTRRYREWVRKAAPGYLEAYDRERRAKHREWLRAYRAASEPVSYACACGLTLNSKSKVDIPRIVRRHNATRKHRRWRDNQELAAQLLDEQVA